MSQQIKRVIESAGEPSYNDLWLDPRGDVPGLKTFRGGKWVGVDNTNLQPIREDISELQGAVNTLSTSKVDKVTGKGLSTNDFTNELKTKYNNAAPSTLGTDGQVISLQSGAPTWVDPTEGSIIDTGLSGDSTNPVQNKVITSAISQLGQQVIYDVTANNGGATFASLSALLSSENLSTLIPVAVRCGGMSIRFVQTSDNKYVQYRLMSNSFNTTPANWQGVDDEPTTGSHNLVESGGVADDITDVKNSLSLLSGHNEFQFYYDGTGGGEHSFTMDKVRVNVKSGDVLTYKFVPITGVYNGSVSGATLRVYFFDENGATKGATPIFEPNVENTYTIQRDDIAFISVSFYKGSAGIYELDYSCKSIEERLSETISSIEADEIKGWILAESFTVRSVMRNIGGDVTSANVTWPDGTDGTLAVTRDSNGNVSQVIATHGEDSFTLAVTRNSDGDVTKTVLTKN